MNLTTAQEMMLDFCEGGNSLRSYKAPHAPKGTPARGHVPREQRRRVIWSKSLNRPAYAKPRLFKGHRP